MKPEPINVAALLRKYHIEPKKSLGQNFLLDEQALEKIILAAEIPAESVVLEIGPGLGSLTRGLARVCRQVVAVELDDRLLPVLEETLAGFTNVTLVAGDILKVKVEEILPKDGYLVVANIPYYITSVVIRHLLEASKKPSRLVLTIQREVAERVCAEPGEMSLLALGVQVYGRPVIVGQIPAGAFLPPPKVDSTVVRVDLYDEPCIPPEQIDHFFFLARAGFSQKRKTLRNTLRAGLRWSAEEAGNLLVLAGIDPQRRAETLSLEEWRRLTDCYCRKLVSLTQPDGF